MVSMSHLYELNQYLQDALHREKLLENKLADLQKLMETTRQASDIGWKALADEDQLLSRIEMLESEIQSYSKDLVDDNVLNKIRKLIEKRNKYQIIARQYMKKFLQEKIGVLKRLNDLQRSLKNKEEECAHFRKLREQNLQDINELEEKYNERLQEAAYLSHKIQESEDLRRETCGRLEKQKQDLAAQLDEQVSIIYALQDRVYALTETNAHGYSKYQYSNHTLLKNKLEIDVGKNNISTGTQVDMISEIIVPKQKNMNNTIECSHFQLKTSEEEEEEERHTEIDELNIRLGELREQQVYIMELEQQLEEYLETKLKNLHLETKLCDTQSDINKSIQMDDTKHEQSVILMDNISKLKDLIGKTRKKKQETEHRIYEIQRESDKTKTKVPICSMETLKTKDLINRENSISSLQLKEKRNQLILTSTDTKQELSETWKKSETETAKADYYASVTEHLNKDIDDVQRSSKEIRNETADLREKVSEIEQKSDVSTNETFVELQRKCFSLQEKIAHLRLKESQLIQRSSKLKDNDVIIHSICQGLPQGVDCDDAILENIENLKEKCMETEKVNISLQEELDVLKNSCIIFNDEKAEIAQELCLYREKYDDLSRQYNKRVHYMKVIIGIFMISALIFLFFQ